MEQHESKGHGGKRPGAGRKPRASSPAEKQAMLRIVATEQEQAEILAGTTPRERAKALLELARRKQA